MMADNNSKNKTPDFPKVGLKYPSLETFARAARKTFKIGRMTLKTKKVFSEGDRVVISITIPKIDDPVDIISQVIDSVSGTDNSPNTYGIRFLNFSELKLKRLESGEPIKPAKHAKPEPEPEPEPPAPTAGPDEEQELSLDSGEEEVVSTQTELEISPPPAEESPEPEPVFPPEAETEEEQQALQIEEPAPQPEEPEAPDPEASSVKDSVAPKQAQQPVPLPHKIPSSFPASTDLSDLPDLSIFDDEEPEHPPELAPEQTDKPVPEQAAPEEADQEPVEPEPPVTDEQADDELVNFPEPEPLKPARGLGIEDQEEAPEEESFESVAVDRLTDLPEPADEQAASLLDGLPDPPSADELMDLTEPEPLSDETDTSLDDLPEPPPADDLLDFQETEALDEPPEQLPETPPTPVKPARGLREEDELPEFDGLELMGSESVQVSDSDIPEPIEPTEASLPDELSSEPVGQEPLEGPDDEEIMEEPLTDAVDELPLQPEESEPVESETPEELEEPDELAGPEDEAEPQEDEAPLPRVDASRKRMGDSEYQALGNFMLKLARSMLSDKSVYDEEGTRLIKSLFEEFRGVIGERTEVSVFLRPTPMGKDFMLEGTGPDPVSIKNKVQGEDANTLVTKLGELFDKKGLLGISFRRYCTEDAFRQFVGLVGKYSIEQGPPVKVQTALIREGVFHITPVFLFDRVMGAEALDWRVSIAIARLHSDVLRINNFAEAMAEDPRALFTLRVEDVLKPIHNIEVLSDMMVYSVLAAKGQNELTSGDIQNEVVLAAAIDKLVEVCEILSSRFEKIQSDLEQTPGDDKLKHKENDTRMCLRRVLARVSFDAPESGMKIMKDLFQRGVLAAEELPPQMRERLQAEKQADDFVTDPDKFLRKFNAAQTADDYKKMANRLVSMLLELVNTGRVDEADKIYQALTTHRKEKDSGFSGRSNLARDALGILSEPYSLEILGNAMNSEGREGRGKIATFLYASGKASVNLLINTLGTSQDRSLRKLCCDILTRMGDVAVPVIKDRILSERIPWYLSRNLLMILGDMNSSAVQEDIEKFLTHEHARVREEALVYAAKMEGAGFEPRLVRALEDPEVIIQRRAAHLLGQLGGSPQEGFAPGDAAVQGLVWLIERKRGSPQEGFAGEPDKEYELMFLQVADVLARLGKRKLQDGRSLEDAFISLAESETKGRGFLGRLTGSKGQYSPRMRAAVCEALGKVGSERSKKILTQFSKDKEDLVRRAAQAALKQL